MKRLLISALGLSLLAGPALAEGDAANGERVFKKCKACHMIVSDTGEEIYKGGKTGPNLWGLPGRVAGSVEGFKYSDALKAAGEKGLVWDEEHFTGFVTDPSKYLSEFLGERAKSKMSFKLRKDQADVWAYLKSVSPVSE